MSRPEEDLKAFYACEMKDRAVRPLGDERTARVTAFAEQLSASGAATVVDVGGGAGRDGLLLGRSGCTYTGVDLSPAAVRICRDQGLQAVEASATSLPFADDSFDAAWSMSTLKHLPGTGFDQAIGVWGHTSNREWTKPDGRYFRHRCDEGLQHALRVLGTVVAFETWDWFDDGGHYQFTRVVVQ